MRNIVRIFADDVRMAVSSVIAVVVLVGLVLAPGLFAWFNIAGSWEPFADTSKLKVAVANGDAGYTGELAPAGVNCGDRVVAGLRDDGRYGWQFVDEELAVAGVEQGEYYAAIVIPADFSLKLMTMYSADAESAEVAYYANLKRTPAIPGSAEGEQAAVSEGIAAAFDEAVGSVALGTLSEVVAVGDDEQMQSAVSLIIARLEGVADSLDVTAGQVRSYAALVKSASSLATSAADALASSHDTADAGTSAIGSAASGLDDASSTLNGAVSALEDALPSVSRSQEGEGSSLTSSANELIGDARSLSDSANSAAGEAARMSESLASTVESIAGSGESLSSDLGSVRKALVRAAKQLEKASDEVSQLSADISQAVTEGDVRELAALIGSDTSAAGRLLTTPVRIERSVVNPLGSYGSSLAPLFSVVGLWLGAVLLVALMRTRVSPERVEALRRPHNFQLYLGRFGVYALVALLQAAVLWAGEVFFLRIECAEPWLLLAACLLCSLVFSNIAYTLVVSFGNVGKVVAYALLAVPLAVLGAGYPEQLMGGLFALLEPFSPSTYAVGVLRECVAGLGGDAFFSGMARLAAFLVPSLAIGLLLRLPLLRLAEYADRQLQRTGIM